MAGLISRIRAAMGPRDRAKPFSEQGVAGFSVYGGYLAQGETNTELLGDARWLKAADILANVSVVAAGLRYILNLISRPSWTFEPVDDTAEAKAMAEFAESVVNGLDTSWTRIVRRSGLYRYHGFGIHEWVAKRRDDGKIGLASIESRPQQTIKRWDIDENGGVLGVWQRDPQTGQELYLPRRKLLYLVDDTLTDRPDGIGWFRHLVDPANRLKSYLELENIGYERDLSGIPIGRAPLQRINELVEQGKITEADKKQMLGALTEFVKLRRKNSETGMVLDSSTYLGKSETGESVSSVYHWGMELLTGSSESIDHLDMAIKRLQLDMSLIMGTESLLVGRDGQGSRALSEDKSRNLYLTANSMLCDMAETVDRDLIEPIWAMNGLPDELRPHAKSEDVAFKDAMEIAQALADMAQAGAILAPDDPAINDLRDLLGISQAEPMDMEMLNALQGRADPTKPPEPEPGTGGGPGKENGPAARKAEKQSLYVSRKLLNASELIEWAKAQGFEQTLDADDMHVTVAFSREPVDWTAAGDHFDTLRCSGGKRSVEPLGDKGAVVLKFEAPELAHRWQEFRDVGASWDYPSYQPHVSITYQGTGIDLSQVEPFTGALEFGPEIFEPVVDDWEKSITEKFDPNQPRDPRGTPTGGQWTSTRATPGDVVFEIAPNPDNKELTERWEKLSDQERAEISQKIADKFTPEILAKLEVEGTVGKAIGGFEGHVNPSFVLTVKERPFEVAGALGHAYSQKAMVITGAEGAPGLSANGFAAVVLPGASSAKLRSLQEDLGDIAADGWTYHNGKMQFLNFSGKSDADFAAEIDKRLGGKYEIGHGTIHSAYVPETRYASPRNVGRGTAWGQVRDSTRERVSAALEEALREVGKAFAAAIEEVLKRFNPDQPRAPKGSEIGGQWVDSDVGAAEELEDRGLHPLDAQTKREITDPLAAKSLDELLRDAADNQEVLRQIGDKLSTDAGVEFFNPGPKRRERVLHKLSEGYEGPHQITDLARVTFVPKTPAQADAIVDSLAKRMAVYDKGWQRLPDSNYMDRKLLARFPNGGIAEIQLVPKEIHDVKNGIGHKLYELARHPRTPPHVREMTFARSREIYHAAAMKTEFQHIYREAGK